MNFTVRPFVRCGTAVRVVGLTRIELVTSSLSGMRSNRLSYSPAENCRTLRLQGALGSPHPRAGQGAGFWGRATTSSSRTVTRRPPTSSVTRLKMTAPSTHSPEPRTIRKSPPTALLVNS